MISGAFTKFRKGTVSFVMSAHLSVGPSEWNNSAPTGRAFMKFVISVFFENLSRKFKFRYEVVLVSPLTDQEGNKLQRQNSGFIQHIPYEAQYTFGPLL
jgi:hypothetical protein